MSSPHTGLIPAALHLKTFPPPAQDLCQGEIKNLPQEAEEAGFSMETNINPTDITDPTTPSISPSIKATISSAYTCSSPSSHTKPCPQITL